jgi:hypothetical protein
MTHYSKLADSFDFHSSVLFTLTAIVALDTAPVARLWALFTHVADAVTVPTNHDSLIGAVRFGVACLSTVEAGSATAATSATVLARVGTVNLVVSTVTISNMLHESQADMLTQSHRS